MNQEQAHARAANLAYNRVKVYKHPGEQHFAFNIYQEGFMAAWSELNPSRPAFGEIADLLNLWEWADNPDPHFSRGLHLLQHLARGGTLEEYGEPDA